ncbi:MAG: hypothetical protein LBT33_08150 [Spirochaetia bacterium]|jgi:hypothetical protein|nr:hypothetical protein [Spirochaetia bacterium]
MVFPYPEMDAKTHVIGFQHCYPVQPCGGKTKLFFQCGGGFFLAIDGSGLGHVLFLLHFETRRFDESFKNNPALSGSISGSFMFA